MPATPTSEMESTCVAHHFGSNQRFFGNRQVAGSGAHQRDFSFTQDGAVAPDAQGARGREVLGIGKG